MEQTGRTATKRRAIQVAATEVFLQHGYLGASMDEVAAKAGVSKQTVYKQFENKERLFADIVLGTNDQLAVNLAAAYAETLEGATDAREALRALAFRLLESLTADHVLQLRRLVIAEADRFPEVCGAWFTRGFEKSLETLGQALAGLTGRGLLRELDDPTLVAYQFAGLVMYKPMNRAMFAGTRVRPEPGELDRIADSAVTVFLSSYGADR
ncbi:TetR/AcrR family transcriptional regulator [Kribbella sandramycini]|uniref:AcrR family transcriptional regulator n=1 Tax=Kribbella sandramycini TaxID=60450 RepID=A0A7Y4P0N4_9ACTN|nr:TetR/AcrR family transcriptional regulator [Kribbella sandramycini]MBB6565799.1 AcrR family transcriptional regulator [Kribbella sandramycini]NOL42063.1 TetR/AcrR family transcriptional regulator [Kribbella sandramycini]